MMKYINPYNDLILEDLLIEAFKLNIKDFLDRKSAFYKPFLSSNLNQFSFQEMGFST